MVETCAEFCLQAESVSVSGADKELTFSALRLRSGRRMKSLQFITVLAPFVCAQDDA